MRPTRLRRGLLCSLASAAFLSACGGSSSDDTAIALAWDKATYSATLVPGSASTIAVPATLTPIGSGLPSTIGIDVTPSGSGGSGPTVGNGPWFVNAQGVAPVVISVPPTSVKGSYPLGATMRIGTTSYTASATLVVN